MSSFQELLRFAVSELSACSETARLDAEVLLAYVARCSREKLVILSAQQAEASQETAYRELIARRKLHEPVAYLTGKKEFWSLEFEVNRAVLIPRPETEIIVEHALKYALARQTRINILDLGTGSGCIAIALALALRKARREFDLLAIDSSLEALQIAEKNCVHHDMQSFIRFKQSNWFDSLDQNIKYDLIVSNPPYVDAADRRLSPELAFEPRQALYAEEKGFAVLKKLIQEVPQHLSTDGLFLCEIGSEQGPYVIEAIQQLWPEYKQRCALFNDLSGLTRMMAIIPPDFI